MANSNGKRRITTADVYAEVTSLKVAVCGHPDVPDDNGLFGDVKYIRKSLEQTTERVEESEVAIAAIAARCEERHGLGATVKEVSKKKIVGIGGGSLTAIATIIYGVGKLVGWW